MAMVSLNIQLGPRGAGLLCAQPASTALCGPPAARLSAGGEREAELGSRGLRLELGPLNPQSTRKKQVGNCPTKQKCLMAHPLPWLGRNLVESP